MGERSWMSRGVDYALGMGVGAGDEADNEKRGGVLIQADVQNGTPALFGRVCAG